MRRVYLDHAATTPVDPRVAETMLTYMVTRFGNASSIHSYGREARKAVEDAREQVAALIGATPQEIVFTSGGTESDNLAVKGVLDAYPQKGKHIITSAIEHHALLHTTEHLEKRGYEVMYVPVNEDGAVTLAHIEQAMRPDTVLVSIMMANNEVGTFQPVEEIGRLCRLKGAFFHTDAVQALGQVPIDVRKMNVDMMSLSAHKIYGPKGVGALYVRKGVRLLAQSHGGSHERGKRAGTENVPGIVGFGKAAELARKEMKERAEKTRVLRDKLIDGIMKSIPDVKLNGHRHNRLPNNANVSIRFIEGESMLLNLDMNGIAASSGSACTSGSLDPSHVLLAMGMCHEDAHGSLRLTLGKDTTTEDIDYVLSVLPGVVNRLRAMSPLIPGTK